jgi:hypothetical protein
MNIGKYIEEVSHFSGLLDKGLSVLREAATEVAHSEYEYRKAKAIAWQSAPAGTVPMREAWVDAETAGQRQRLDLAEGSRSVALEAVRSRRQQLSAVQSLLAAHKAEADFARTGPA